MHAIWGDKTKKAKVDWGYTQTATSFSHAEIDEIMNEVMIL
jgi:hypothetical protein